MEDGALIRIRVFVFFEKAIVANGTRRVRGRGNCYGDRTVTLVAKERLIGNAGGVRAAAIDVPVERHVSRLGWFQQERQRERNEI